MMNTFKKSTKKQFDELLELIKDIEEKVIILRELQFEINYLKDTGNDFKLNSFKRVKEEFKYQLKIDIEHLQKEVEEI